MPPRPVNGQAVLFFTVLGVGAAVGVVSNVASYEMHMRGDHHLVPLQHPLGLKTPVKTPQQKQRSEEAADPDERKPL